MIPAELHPTDGLTRLTQWSRFAVGWNFSTAAEPRSGLVPNSSEKTWWVFDRKTAPQFVYIRPQMWVFLRHGEVVRSEAANTPGNGVEVHAESEGTGPFAGMFPVDDQANLLADEFRLYYKVAYAPDMNPNLY